MKTRVLVDAGPLVALLHADDVDHAACIAALRTIRRPLLTTWPPIVEAMYLLAFSLDAQTALLEMLERGALEVLPLDTRDLEGVRTVMHRYHDVPADFADATLVHVAEREKLRVVFTLDRRDFGIYRVGRGRGRAFELLPD